MATGLILHRGYHVTAITDASRLSLADEIVFKRRVRSFWAYFSVDR